MDELAQALIVLGDAERFSLNLTAAADAYRRASTVEKADPVTRAQARLGAAVALMTIDPAQSAALLDAVLAESTPKGEAKTRRAQVEALRGRAAINLGDLHGATRWLERAVADSGGLTPKVSIGEIEMRGDAAIAYQLLHDDVETHKYLTLTGAGHLKSEDWARGVDTPLPVCGQAGVRPDDTAVVEFAIDAEGRVVGALPIYASRPGDVGTVFTQAVAGWRWSAEGAAKLDPFWRASVRIQLRCVARPQPTPLAKEFAHATAEWFVAQGMSATDFEDESVRPLVPSGGASAVDGLAALPELLAALHRSTSSQKASSLLARVEAVLTRAKAPPEVHAYAIYRLVNLGGNSFRGQAESTARALAAALPAFDAAWPHTRAGVWLRLERAIALETTGDFATAVPELAGIAGADPHILGSGDAICRIATLHLAAIEQARGDASAAEARLAAAGLDAAQCSLIDVRPVATNQAIASSDFPTEALRWNFQGYVRESFDIAADGRVANVRTVLAYPPFVFDGATEHSVARFRYLPPTADGHALGCTAQTVNVRYLVPNR